MPDRQKKHRDMGCEKHYRPNNLSFSDITAKSACNCIGMYNFVTDRTVKYLNGCHDFETHSTVV